MKKLLTILTIMLVFFGISGMAYAFPNFINIQGKLTDAQYNAKSGIQNFTFTLYNANSSGTARFSENMSINVVQGLWSHKLGSNNTLNLRFEEDYFVEIGVNGQTLNPRLQIGAVGYAYRTNYSTYTDNIIAGGNASGLFNVRGPLNVEGNLNASAGLILHSIKCDPDTEALGTSSSGSVICVPKGTANGSLISLVNISNGTFNPGDYTFPGNVIILQNLSVNGTLNLSSTVILNDIICADGEVLTTRTDGIVKCVPDVTSVSGGVTVPAANVSGGTFGSIFGYIMNYTFPGNLNVTNNLFVQGAATVLDKIGIGLTNPINMLAILGPSNSMMANITDGITSFGIYIGALSGGNTGASIGTISGDQLRLFTNNTDRVVIDAEGKVGIGTITPNSALSVNGSINVSKELILDNLRCSSGYLLTTSENGSLVCASAAGAVGGSTIPIGNVTGYSSSNCTGTNKVINVTFIDGVINVTCAADTGGTLEEGIIIPIGNVTGYSSSNCTGTNKVINVTFIDGVIEVTCGADTGGSLEAGITIPAENITSGTLADARLSTNVTNLTNTPYNMINWPFANISGYSSSNCTGTNKVINVTFIDGVIQVTCAADTGGTLEAGITIPAENVTSGTLADARLSANVTNLTNTPYNMINWPFANLSGYSSSNCTGTNKVINVSFIDGIINVTCGADTTGTESGITIPASNVTGSALAKFTGETANYYDGNITNGSKVGYDAANNICNSEYPDSHMCITSEIINTISSVGFAGNSGSGWIANGPPGYTATANDCRGWTSDSATALGSFWNWDDSAGGGVGWLTACTGTKPLYCCK